MHEKLKMIGKCMHYYIHKLSYRKKEVNYGEIDTDDITVYAILEGLNGRGKLEDFKFMEREEYIEKIEDCVNKITIEELEDKSKLARLIAEKEAAISRIDSSYLSFNFLAIFIGIFSFVVNLFVLVCTWFNCPNDVSMARCNIYIVVAVGILLIILYFLISCCDTKYHIYKLEYLENLLKDKINENRK
jgi:hypothetical protein